MSVDFRAIFYLSSSLVRRARASSLQSFLAFFFHIVEGIFLFTFYNKKDSKFFEESGGKREPYHHIFPTRKGCVCVLLIHCLYSFLDLIFVSGSSQIVLSPPRIIHILIHTSLFHSPVTRRLHVLGVIG